MATSNSNEFCQLDGKELELLDRFLTRTVFSITPAKTICLYENEIFKLTCIYPFLMHAALMVTLLHDRHLATVANTNLTAAEAFHYYQGTALFNSKLSGPLQGFERDALWVAAAILGTISFCYIEAKTPEEAWPLKPSSSLDLNWLTLSEGKMQVWEITQVIARPDSIFRELALEHKDFSMTAPGGPGLEALPYGFTAFYNLNATSTVDNNPYYAAALSVAQSMHLTCDYTTNMRFMMFIMKMQIEYKQLLLRKDPRALLLLAYWYAKVCQFEHWWFLGRATLECQAICIFLDRFHGNDANIQALLQFPRTIFTRSAWKSALEDLSPDMMDEVGVLP
ncbi:hypothetical protein MMC11_003575 [Xylographa trunciseda]|nr:hypothetical protein [Xylographa trunciseda]